MYSSLKNSTHDLLGSTVLTPIEAPAPEHPVLELRRVMRKGRTVWVPNGRGSTRMLRVASRNGKVHSHVEPGRGPVSVALYDTALTAAAYGRQTPQLGDLFNDVVGAIVPGWDKRPDWMKKIKVNADPAKFLSAAQRFVPPSQIEKILGVGQQYGITPSYSGIPITPGGGAFGYQYGGVGMALADIPAWVYLAGGGLVLLLLVGSRSR